MKIGSQFSDYGYHTLDIWFDLDTSNVAPVTLQKLSALLCFFERHPDQIADCLTWLDNRRDRGEERLQSLLSLMEHLDIN